MVWKRAEILHIWDFMAGECACESIAWIALGVDSCTSRVGERGRSTFWITGQRVEKCLVVVALDFEGKSRWIEAGNFF